MVFEGTSAEVTYVGGGVDIPLWLMTPENEALLPGRHGGEATQGEQTYVRSSQSTSVVGSRGTGAL